MQRTGLGLLAVLLVLSQAVCSRHVVRETTVEDTASGRVKEQTEREGKTTVSHRRWEWSTRTITGEGKVAIPPGAETRAQGLILAEDGAKAKAFADALEQVEGLYLDSQTRVVDSMGSSGKVKASVRGLVRQAKVVSRDCDPEAGLCTVIVEVALSDLSRVLEEYYH